MSDRLSLIAFTTLLSVVLLAGCNKPAEQPAPPPPAVTLAHPISHEVIEWDEYTGNLAAKEKVDVRARVSGFIEEASFDEGNLVEKGQLLFVIDPRPFEAELAQQSAEVKRAEAQQRFAANEFKRLEDLRPRGGASETEVENARQRMLEAEAAVAAAEARRKAAELDVNFTQVTAPISGRISRKLVTPGNLINGGAGEATLLTTITSIDPIYAYMDVDEASVLKYQRLSLQNKRTSAREMKIPVYMGLSNEEGFPHEGVIDFVDNSIDPATGTLRARGVFANPTGYLTPGMFARLRVPGTGRYEATLVPDSAIGIDQDQRFVLVVNRENVVERRLITPGAQFGRLRAVEAGVTTDDRIIVNGLMRVRPGVTVDPQMSEIDAALLPDMAAGSPATQELPTTRKLPATRSVVTTTPTTAPATTAASAAATIGAMP